MALCKVLLNKKIAKRQFLFVYILYIYKLNKKRKAMDKVSGTHYINTSSIKYTTFPGCEDAQTNSMTSIANLVNWQFLSPNITGANGIANPDLDYCAGENSKIGTYDYNSRENSTRMFIA